MHPHAYTCVRDWRVVWCGKQVDVDAFVAIACDELQKMKLEANRDSVSAPAAAGGRWGLRCGGSETYTGWVEGEEDGQEEEEIGEEKREPGSREQGQDNKAQDIQDTDEK